MQLQNLLSAGDRVSIFYSFSPKNETSPAVKFNPSPLEAKCVIYPESCSSTSTKKIQFLQMDELSAFGLEGDFSVEKEADRGGVTATVMSGAAGAGLPPRPPRRRVVKCCSRTHLYTRFPGGSRKGDGAKARPGCADGAA